MSDATVDEPDIEAVRNWLTDLQNRVCAALEAIDGSVRFSRDEIDRGEAGLSRPRVLEDGRVLERAAVNFSHTRGKQMPPAATERRPELAGGRYEAVSMSLITHPRNPHAPTSHANFRCFVASKDGVDPVWWFGGGFDLTPHYGYVEDCVHWHETARNACVAFGDEIYPRFKANCDEYFFLPHRNEARGVGGLFFDDLCDGGFERSFALTKSCGEAYLPAYLPILERRKDTAFGDAEREWQLVRRGRYVEFNLVYDRGTKFGLQAGARSESVLASMPPLVRWRYDWHPPKSSPEAALSSDFLTPRNWLNREAT